MAGLRESWCFEQIKESFMEKEVLSRAENTEFKQEAWENRELPEEKMVQTQGEKEKGQEWLGEWSVVRLPDTQIHLQCWTSKQWESLLR